MFQEEQLVPLVHALHDAVPGVEPFDAHVHVGLRDPSGYQATAEEVLGALERSGCGGLVFPLKDPDGYAAPNREVAELAAEHPGRLRALCRLDPADDPVAEARAGLAAGAVGLKLHPRGEDFTLDDTRLDEVFALAGAERLPIVIHAGAGDDAVVAQALRRAEDHPGARLILAHCAIADLPGAAARAHELPNVFFDTAWWNPADVWALLHLAPPAQVLLASDIPFAGPGLCQLLTGRLALQAGIEADGVRLILGGQARRLVEHADPVTLPASAAPGTPDGLAPELERLYVTLCSVVEPMLRGEPEGQGLALARAACRSGASGPHGPLLGWIGELLDRADEVSERDPLRPLRTPGFDLVLAAAILARTPDVPVPDR